MKYTKHFILAACLVPTLCMAQQVIPISVDYEEPGVEETVTVRDGQNIISGVTKPSITVYLPSEQLNTGTAVILCSGGAMRFHSWTNDVERMAKFLNARGIAAIGLKYRLNNAKMNFSPGAMPPMPEMVDVTKFDKFPMANANPMPSVEGDAANMRAIDDARAAVRMVREHAAEWNITPE